MCLLVLAWRAHPRYRLIVAANRDEFHERAAAPLAAWADPPMVAGRDLRADGTWLGVDREGRFGSVTNFRELQRPRSTGPSRGGLIPAYMVQRSGPGEFLAATESASRAYSGFNLLLADREELWYACNRAPGFARPLRPGIYGLSNRFLDTPWPKLERTRRRFGEWLGTTSTDPTGDLLRLLDDRAAAPDDTELSQLELPADLARALSSPFVLHPVYGTRCSTVLLVEESGAATITERRFDAQGNISGQTELQLNA